MSRIRDYGTHGEPSSSSVRVAAGLDFVTAVIIAMLGFPFPIVRASVSVPVFVFLVFVAIAVVHFLYLTVTAPLLGRTPGLYLMDLGFEGGPPAASRAWRWAFGMVITFLPGVLGLADLASGFAARISGLPVRSTDGGSR